MRKFIVLASVSLALAACGADQPAQPAQPAGQGQAPSLQAGTQQSARKPAPADQFDQALESLAQRSAASIRYDRIRTLEDGTKQRQVFVEMLGATAEETDAHATQVFEEAGFTTRKGLVDGNGIRLAYRKAGGESISALIRSAEAGPPLNDPAATSSLYIRQSVD
ncbi:hypothetical protein [Luteimonas padinae]|uniref:Uncharacterized protein n=1 Tax=Luteimonas padinae TaxID=1714359 RepID=A0ABV6SYW6_9GAMM|nr:hypothetical protein [Luteimonas padinae]